MSSKGEDKGIYYYEKSSKQNKINTSEKIIQHNINNTHNGHKDIKEEKYLEDYEIKHYAESKYDKHRNENNNNHNNNTLSIGKLGREISNESLEEAEEADREFENLMRKPNEGLFIYLLISFIEFILFYYLIIGTIALPSNSQAKAIMDGFQM